MKLVIDSNVFFSAFSGRGICFELVDWCLEHHEVFISDEILEEVDVNLRKRSKASPAAVQEAIDALRSEGNHLKPLEVNKGATRDPKDLYVLGLAIAAHADLLITGDQDLLVLKTFKGTTVLSPRDAWLKLRSN